MFPKSIPYVATEILKSLKLFPIASRSDPHAILPPTAQASFVEADLHYFVTLD